MIKAGTVILPTFFNASMRSLAGLFKILTYLIRKSSLNVRIALKYLEIFMLVIAKPAIPDTIVRKSRINHTVV